MAVESSSNGREYVALGDSDKVRYSDLPEQIILQAANSAQSMAAELLSQRTITTTEFAQLRELAADARRGALALLPISFAHLFLYAVSCLDLSGDEQADLYRRCEVSLTELIAVNDKSTFLKICREAYRLHLKLTLEANSHPLDDTNGDKKVRFGFTDELVRFAFRIALGRREADLLEDSIVDSDVVAALNLAAAGVGPIPISLYVQDGCKYRWC